MSVQERFLNECRKTRTVVSIYLIGGIQLRGVVVAFDTFCIVLESPGRPYQLLYKSAITNLMPQRPINLKEKEDKTQEEKENVE